jgi:predicted glycosyltransferase
MSVRRAVHASGTRAFVYVQHLLGIGHLKRAATLAHALAAEGLEVTLASGGAPVPGFASDLKAGGVRLVQLPPASAADLTFKMLLDAEGREIDAQWKRRRREALLAAWRAADPHALVIELFPFGRRQMRFELLPLLEAAAASARRPTIACSVRDVLGGRQSSERQRETVKLIERYFDWILVHGDPAVISFDRTFPLAAGLQRKIRYTGYVVDGSGRDGNANAAGKDEVIVSAGGGAVGAGLLETAIRSRPLSALRDRTWRVLAGSNLGEGSFSALAALAALASETGEGRVVVERARRDFTTLLANCEISISQAGYNTLMEILQARTRAVVVPFAGGHETEQTLRARCFAERGLLELVEESALAPQTLAAAIDRALRKPRPLPDAIDLAGAGCSATLIAQWAAEKVS